MSLTSNVKAARRMLLSRLNASPMALGNLGPVVSFCFDDFPATAYRAGGAILKNYGALGTYYAAMGLANTSNHLGDHFSSRDLDDLLHDGHELGCHTFSHISCRAFPLHAFEDDVRKGNAAVRELTGAEAVNFSYPFGHVTLAAKKKIGGLVLSSRGVYGGVNAPQADLNLLRANGLYGDVDSFNEMESLLSMNQKQKGWLIFYTHDVRPNPSKFGCTPELLDKLVLESSRRGCPILTIGKVIESIQGGRTVMNAMACGSRA